MSDRLLSILCPAWNCSEYLPCAIESIQAQTYTNWELIIVDDGSTDELLSVANTYAKKDDRIWVFKIPHGGHSVAINVALSHAGGELIGRQDADDWSLPDRFQRQIEELDRQGADLVSCLMQRVRKNGRVTLGRSVGGSGCIPRDFCTGKNTKGPAAATLVVKRAVYDRLGGFRTDVPGHMMGSTDSDWIFRALLVDDPPYKWAHVHDELYCYRDHPKQGTKTHSAVAVADHLRFQQEYAPRILARLDREEGKC